MLIVCHWLSGWVLFAFLPRRKLSEMSMSRALCIELWRRILVTFLNTFPFVWENDTALSQKVQTHRFSIERSRFLNRKHNRLVLLTRLFFCCFFFFFCRKVHLLWWAKPCCVEEAVGARKEDVSHHQQPFWFCVSKINPCLFTASNVLQY